MDEVTEESRKLNNDEPNYLYPSPNNIWVIKSKGMGWDGMGWDGHIASVEERTGAYKVFGGET